MWISNFMCTSEVFPSPGDQRHREKKPRSRRKLAEARPTLGQKTDQALSKQPIRLSMSSLHQTAIRSRSSTCIGGALRFEPKCRQSKVRAIARGAPGRVRGSRTRESRSGRLAYFMDFALKLRPLAKRNSVQSILPTSKNFQGGLWHGIGDLRRPVQPLPGSSYPTQ